MRFALVDGAPADALPLDDRGLHYGDGLFETLSVHGGRAGLLDRHLQRLARGCAALGLPAPDAGLLALELEAAAARLGEGVLKLVLTRGGSERGYAPPADPRPRRIVLAQDAAKRPPAWWTEGVRARVCATRLGRNARLAGLKHLNRLEQVLARAEWQDPDVAEGLMLDDRDDLVCATSANVFLVLQDALVTPAVDEAGVAGVVRDCVLEAAARLGIPARVRRVPAAELARASEVMLSNSLVGLWRVRDLDGHAYRDDAVWRRLAAALPPGAGAGGR
jgi:4-amino-4-deoxychorismate lyase